MLRSFAGFFKRNIVMAAAMCAAAITCCFVPVDAAYLDYFDWKTLICLFCMLAVVCALKNIYFFYLLARKLAERFRTARNSVLALVYITFLGSMLIANDMALLTFLPLGFLVLDSTGKQHYMAFTFVMQNIAANLGGMLTPFGNPQNLYLYSRYNIPTLEFLRIMAPPFCISVALITVCCLLFVKPEPLSLPDAAVALPRRRTVVYLLLFILAIAIVFRGVPCGIGLGIILAVLLLADRKALTMVDYPLLLTFFFFFIFSGNMARIEAVRQFFSMLLGKSVLLVSVASCQCISNVPSAILLSQFTQDYPALLVGVNIGGVGTLVASLASLITFREFSHSYPNQTGHYLRVFSALNAGFLLILTACMYRML